MIEPKAKQIIEETFKRALAMLMIPPLPYSFVYEKMGVRFQTIENAEEVDNLNRIIYVNEDWANDRLVRFPYDLYFLQAHETRHIYQHIQINLLASGGQLNEDRALVVSWIQNFQSYQRNEGGNTIRPYHRQPVEVDADAFANFFVLVNGVGQARIPDDSEDLITQRLIEIGHQFGVNIGEAD